MFTMGKIRSSTMCCPVFVNWCCKTFLFKFVCLSFNTRKLLNSCVYPPYYTPKNSKVVIHKKLDITLAVKGEFFQHPLLYLCMVVST